MHSLSNIQGYAKNGFLVKKELWLWTMQIQGRATENVTLYSAKPWSCKTVWPYINRKQWGWEVGTGVRGVFRQIDCWGVWRPPDTQWGGDMQDKLLSALLFFCTISIVFYKVINSREESYMFYVQGQNARDCWLKWVESFENPLKNMAIKQTDIKSSSWF